MVFELEGATIQAGDRTLLEDAELWLERGEHVSLVGPNGAGKTTLLETLAGRREPAGGRLRRGHNVQVGLLSQHADELPPGGTVVEAARRATGLQSLALQFLSFRRGRQCPRFTIVSPHSGDCGTRPVTRSSLPC